MPTSRNFPVSALLAQSECIIHSLGPDAKIAQRLGQMGILPGTHLHIIRLAPLGGTFEVATEQGQSFALRQEEVEAMGCEPLAMPLASDLVEEKKTYRVRILLGGKTFHNRMEQIGIREGTLLQLLTKAIKPLIVHLPDQDKEIKLGEGEAKKIILEVINGDPS